MSYLNTKERYGTLSIGLHWLMLLLLTAVYACVELRDFFPKGSETRNNFMTWHFSLGLTVFALVCFRLVARLVAPEPAISPKPARWQIGAAKLMHGVLYAMMIFLPLAGYLGRGSAGRTTYFFGMALPDLMETNKALARTIFDFHELAGNAGYFLIGLHAVAALFHHYIQRDNTMSRMWFRQGR